MNKNNIRVGLDISQTAHVGGVAKYTENLGLELSKLDNLEMIYFYSSLRKPYKGGLKNVKKFKLPPTLFEILFNKLRNIPIEKFIGEVDIFHSSDWIQPKTKAVKITTYHDVIPLKFPQWSDPKIVEVQKRRLKIVEQEVDKIIAVSKTTKKDLLEISNIPEEKIVVIYEGVTGIFRPQPKEKIEEFRKKYNLPKIFALAIGGIGERKNLKRIKKAAKDFDLVVLGADIVNIDELELPLLYSCASVLIYTSLYEGFGLPIIEAQACGIPVVTSNLGSMKEIGEGSCLIVDPQNIDQIREKLNSVMEDIDLRDDLVTKGLKNAKKFSWEKAALETLEVYSNMVA